MFGCNSENDITGCEMGKENAFSLPIKYNINL